MESRTLQPNSRHCFVCGLANPHGLKLRFYNQGIGRVVAESAIPEYFQGYPGTAHGGIVAAMLDEAAGRSLMIQDPANAEQGTRFMLTARLDIRYRQRVPVETPLRLVGEAGKAKGRTATAKAYLYDGQGELLAEAEALLVDLPDGLLPEAEPQALGWRVYPEEDEL